MKSKVIILGLTLLLLLVKACQPFTKDTASASEKLLADLLDEGEVLKKQDSHGGFHGDGLTFIQMAYPDDRALARITKDEHWHPLPLPDALDKAAYGSEHHGVYLSDDETPLIERIEEGYYFFLDRHLDAKDPWDPTDVLNRGSYNFILAIYDSQTDTLSYFRLDT